MSGVRWLFCFLFLSAFFFFFFFFFFFVLAELFLYFHYVFIVIIIIIIFIFIIIIIIIIYTTSLNLGRKVCASAIDLNPSYFLQLTILLAVLQTVASHKVIVAINRILIKRNCNRGTALERSAENLALTNVPAHDKTYNKTCKSLRSTCSSTKYGKSSCLSLFGQLGGCRRYMLSSKTLIRLWGCTVA